MATFSDIGLSQPAASTITMKLRSVTHDVNSTIVHQEVLTLGDAESTLGLARVLPSWPASTAYGLVTREARQPATFYNSTTSTVVSTASTALYALVSSAASTRACVYAFAVMSTSPTAITAEFLSSGTSLLWSVDSGAGVTGGNLAVSPPARVFHTSAGEALNLRLSSTGKEVRYCLSWFVE